MRTPDHIELDVVYINNIPVSCEVSNSVSYGHLYIIRIANESCMVFDRGEIVDIECDNYKGQAVFLDTCVKSEYDEPTVQLLNFMLGGKS